MRKPQVVSRWIHEPGNAQYVVGMLPTRQWHGKGGGEKLYVALEYDSLVHKLLNC